MKEYTNMKSDEQIIKLSENPFYVLTPQEQQRLESIKKSGTKVSSVAEDSKKKQSQAVRGNATVKETGKLKKHSSDPVSE